MENCRVLVSDQKIEQMKDLIPVLEQITRANQPLFIVTEDITGDQPVSALPVSHVAALASVALCWAHSRLKMHKALGRYAGAHLRAPAFYTDFSVCNVHMHDIFVHLHHSQLGRHALLLAPCFESISFKRASQVACDVGGQT